MESYASPLICLVYFPPHNGFESHSLCWDINSLSLSIAVISNYMTIAKFVFFLLKVMFSGMNIPKCISSCA